MLDSLKSLVNIPEHWIALGVIILGASIAVTHLPHAYEVGSTLTACGLTMYRGVSKSAE